MANSSDIQITEEVKRQYFIIIPLMVDDLGLSPYAFRLYARIVRRAGDGGACWENTRNLAAACHMSEGKVSQAKKELLEAKLITIEKKKNKHGGYDYHHITINDIWRENIKIYSSSQDELASSPDEPSSSQGEPKKNQLSRVQVKEEKAASSAAPYKRPSKNDGRLEKAATDSLLSHPAMKAIKSIANFYPRKNLRARIIDLLGDSPDTELLQECFDYWTEKGWNPMNLDWVFDLYKTKMYYVSPALKLPPMKTQVESIQSESIDIQVDEIFDAGFWAA